MSKLKKVTLPKTCSLCDLPANTGLIDMAEGGAFASFCPLHLKRFCEKTLKTMIADKGTQELRLRQGRLDDIVLSGGDLHLEDMTGKSWWLGFYQGDKRISFSLESKSKITVKVQDNELKVKEVEQEK